MAEIAVRFLYPGIVPTTMYDWSLRHAGYTLQKPPNTFRIVVLGDSFTFGMGVKKEETFAYRLESLLNSKSSETRVEVINLGFLDLNTVQELIVLTQKGLNPSTWSVDSGYYGLAYQPDMVLVEYTLNDVTSTKRFLLEDLLPNQRRFKNGHLAIQYNSGPYALPLPNRIDMFLTNNSRFYLFFLGRYTQILARLGLREGGNSAIVDTIEKYNENYPGWIYVKQALYGMANIAKQKEIPIVLIAYPYMELLDKYPYKMVHKKVCDTANTLGFYTHDLLPAFEGLDVESLRVNLIDHHPNARSHEIAAADIFTYLKKERLAPR
ncbi:MAG: hypothetical protein Q7T53_08890 [Deltaproteobacteria bacterium]|nr:hypothetical protein [Deltaproteobacteria bacterium]